MISGGKPFQSKLEPHFELIASSRRQRQTWAQIAELVRERGTDCTPQGLLAFFKARKKRRYALGMEPESHEMVVPIIQPIAEEEVPTGKPVRPVTEHSKPRPRRMPQPHAKPYASALWHHLDTIRALRQEHKTWAAISVYLERAHGLKISLKTVQNFFRRASRGRLPLGFRNTEAADKIVSPPNSNNTLSPLATLSSPLAELQANPEPKTTIHC